MSAPVATEYTLKFVRSHLPQNAVDILEIGCGVGELAAALVGKRLHVLALDADSDSLAVTAARGVETYHASWPADLERTFDAILFTRSLHHIHPLDQAIAAARGALRRGGALIVEDFRSEGAGRRSSTWYRNLTRSLHASLAFVGDIDLDQLHDADDVDGHHLNSSSDIETALRESFPSVEAWDSAYYFRYLEGSLRDPRAADELLAHELSMIDGGLIEPLGRRFVAYA